MKNMIHPASAYQAFESGQRRALFTLFGVPWTATGESWRFNASRLAAGLAASFIFLRAFPAGERLLYGLLFGLLLGLSNFLHIIGHLISGKLAGAPMDENLVTPYSILTAYHEDPAETPERVHLARAAGDPLATLLLASSSFAAWRLLGGPAWGFLAAANGLLLGMVILPLPGADRQVIWRQLLPPSSDPSRAEKEKDLEG